MLGVQLFIEKPLSLCKAENSSWLRSWHLICIFSFPFFSRSKIHWNIIGSLRKYRTELKNAYIGSDQVFIFPSILDKWGNTKAGKEYSYVSSCSQISWFWTTSLQLINSLSFINVFNCFQNSLIFWHLLHFVAINFSKEMSIFSSV